MRGFARIFFLLSLNFKLSQDNRCACTQGDYRAKFVLFEQRYGVAFDVIFGARLAPLEAAGLLERVDGWLRLSARGRLLGNEVFERVLPD
jgi:coproporphyrinogen III oxidase-like Fe-S oxidoreductase